MGNFGKRKEEVGEIFLILFENAPNPSFREPGRISEIIFPREDSIHDQDFLSYSPNSLNSKQTNNLTNTNMSGLTSVFKIRVFCISYTPYHVLLSQ